MPKKTKDPKPSKKAAAAAQEATEAKEAPPEPWTCAECGQEHEGEEAASTECVACGHPRPHKAPGAAAAEEDEDDKFRGIKCGVVVSVEDLADKVSRARAHERDPARMRDHPPCVCPGNAFGRS